MKKLLLVVLILIVSINFGSVCFAAQGDIVDMQSVQFAVYDENGNWIEDEPIAEASAQQQEVIEEDVPKASALPQTGGIPAEAFYAVGAILIISALFISMKKAKPASK